MACAELAERREAQLRLHSPQRPGEVDAASPLPFLSFSGIEESELRELKWHAQESQVQLLSVEVQRELPVFRPQYHMRPSQGMAPRPSMQALQPQTQDSQEPSPPIQSTT